MTREYLGITLMVITYLCYAIFLWRVIWRIFLLLKIPDDRNKESLPTSQIAPMTILRGIRDVLFLTRLFRVNKLLWVGEWIFHWTFFLVLVRHLKYFLSPIPAFISGFDSLGLFAGYVFYLSLIYILIVKYRIEKSRYFSTYNFFLLILLVMIGLTGILMRNIIRPDIVEIKYFVLNLLIFNPVSIPQSMLFNIHFNMTLVFLVSLPTHIFAAPYTILHARQCEDRFELLIHEK
jgi:nitrate reductase gamma subunit